MHCVSLYDCRCVRASSTSPCLIMTRRLQRPLGLRCFIHGSFIAVEMALLDVRHWKAANILVQAPDLCLNHQKKCMRCWDTSPATVAPTWSFISEELWLVVFKASHHRCLHIRLEPQFCGRGRTTHLKSVGFIPPRGQEHIQLSINYLPIRNEMKITYFVHKAYILAQWWNGEGSSLQRQEKALSICSLDLNAWPLQL